VKGDERWFWCSYRGDMIKDGEKRNNLAADERRQARINAKHKSSPRRRAESGRGGDAPAGVPVTHIPKGTAGIKPP
jgi:hypothetical protein